MDMVRASLINIRSSKPRHGNKAALVFAVGIQCPLRSHYPKGTTGRAAVSILLTFIALICKFPREIFEKYIHVLAILGLHDHRTVVVVLLNSTIG